FDELHIAQSRTCSIGSGESITGSCFRIRTLRIHLRAAACGKQGRPGTANRDASFVLNLRTSDAIPIDNEAPEKTERRDRDVRMRLNSGQKSDDNDFPRKATVAMNDAWPAVAPFAGQGERIASLFKIRAPFQQVFDFCRTFRDKNAYS